MYTSELRTQFVAGYLVILRNSTLYNLTGQRDIRVRVNNEQPSCWRLGNDHNQSISPAEWDSGGAGTNVPEGECHCKFGAYGLTLQI